MFLEQRSAKNREVNRRYKLLKARRAMEEGSDDDGSSDDDEPPDDMQPQWHYVTQTPHRSRCNAFSESRDACLVVAARAESNLGYGFAGVIV